MAITFDDLPAHGDKPRSITRLRIGKSIVDTLKQNSMPPTYGFVNGSAAEGDPWSERVLPFWHAAGQPLANHTYSHFDFDTISVRKEEADTLRNEAIIKKYAGASDWHWFRFPFLHEGNMLEKRRAFRTWLEQHHYKVAEVSMDFEDYLWNEPYARCADKGDKAAIQRLHDTYLATADEYITYFRALSKTLYGRDIRYILLMHIGAFDARMLPELLALYRQRGFTFISLPEAEADPVYRQDPDIGILGGGTFEEMMMHKRNLPMPTNTKPYKELEDICK
jgi:peptidoglycan/xylan/chitin deacetylase (PgdA/CDA1 family)